MGYYSEGEQWYQTMLGHGGRSKGYNINTKILSFFFGLKYGAKVKLYIQPFFLKFIKLFGVLWQAKSTKR